MSRRITHPWILTLTIAIVTITGCASISAHGPGTPDESVTYNCDQGTFTVTYGNDRKTAYLQMGIQTIVLDKTPSLAPAVYSADGLSFWPEGTNNVFVKRDMSALYQNCSSVR